MKTVIQRVKKGVLYTEGIFKGEISAGLAILTGVEKGDTEKDCAYLARKILSLRIFENAAGRMDYSLTDVKGDIMIVSQFTLCGSCKRGSRPDFTDAEVPEKAVVLYSKLAGMLRQSVEKVVQGDFGKEMLVEIHNDGPVTIILNSK